MGIFKNWTKDIKPPRIIIEWSSQPQVTFENVDDEESAILIGKIMFGTNYGGLRAIFADGIKKNLPEKISSKVIETWEALEFQRQANLSAPPEQQAKPAGYILPTEVIPRAISRFVQKQQNGDD